MEFVHGAIYRDDATGWHGKCLLPEYVRKGLVDADAVKRIDLIGMGPKGVAEKREIKDRSQVSLIAAPEDLEDPNYIPVGFPKED